jgi:hypothetical protein
MRVAAPGACHRGGARVGGSCGGLFQGDPADPQEALFRLPRLRFGEGGPEPRGLSGLRGGHGGAGGVAGRSSARSGVRDAAEEIGLRALPRPEDADCNQLASDRTANFYRGYVMSRRLNRAEYLNTLRDLFGMDTGVDDLVPADGGGGEGFDTSGNALFLSPIHIERYLDAAEKALAIVLPDRARDATPEARRARRQILTARPGPELSAREAAEKVISGFARRAFRRPASAEEVEGFLRLFDRAQERGDGYVASIRLALQGILISPHFLFLAEPEPDAGGVHPLAPIPLASKLSYFLWSSMPDERLLILAETGALADTNIYLGEVRRMLKDPKSRALGERFALQWLDLEKLGAGVAPDPARFPECDSGLLDAMREEVVRYVHHVLSNDRSLLELVDSQYVIVNERLAALYGIDDVSGDEYRLVQLSSRSRGGLLGMAAVHAATSYPLRTSPVLRGRWVLEALLGDKVPPPPPDVPALEEEHGEDAASMTLRQQLEAHRTRAECAACHDKIDPLGFGLENFDVLGRWRETDRGLPLDATGTLPSGESFEGPEGLKEVLLARRDRIMRLLAKKMTGYALGRELNRFDDCVVDRAVEALQANDYRSSILVETIAMSFPFRHRFYPKNDS